jgi:tRNA (guanine37-N1)-methyltransferase
MTRLDLGVITLFPEMFSSLNHGITGRAIRNQLANTHFWNPRDFATDTHRTVDDRPYGGGPGMVMKFEPLKLALSAAKKQLGESAHVIHLSPQGRPLTQSNLSTILANKTLILLCGRYEGVDERLIEAEVDEEWSIGDFVVSGGELPAMLMIDALIRLIPGALGHEDSAKEDSFSHGLLDHPHYTRPDKISGRKVPAVLQSGNHAEISRWRRKQALGRTWQRRPDLLKRRTLEQLEQRLLDEFIAESTADGSNHSEG